MAVKIQFEIGHTSKLKIKKTREGFTHDWELYVKGVNGADITCFIEKVVFNLHDSFPKPKRVCKEPPYVIQESGYAGFMLPIDIYLRNRDDPKMLQFNYDLALHTVGPPQHRSDIQKYIFENPSEEFRQKLMKGGGIPVAGVTSGGAITTPLTLTHNVENHKSVVGENKKHKSRSEELKVASFSDLFGPPITKGTCPTKQSPDYRSSVNSSNQMIIKSNSHLTHSSISCSNSNKEKLNKDKNLSSGNNREKSKEHKERSAKSSSGASPQKEVGRSSESKSKHDRRDKTDDKSKKEKNRDKDKERNRKDRNSSGNVHQGISITTTANISMTSSVAAATSLSKRLPNNSPKREVTISPHGSSPATLTTNTAHFNIPNARPSSSNGGRFEIEGKTLTKDQTKLIKDTAGSIEIKSKDPKGRDVNSISSSSTTTSYSGKKSKKDRKEKDKDKDRDRERDKEKQKSTETNQISRIHNQQLQNSNGTTDVINMYNIENKSSKPSGTNANTLKNIEAISIKREKPLNHKIATNETKSMERITSTGPQSTLSSTAASTTTVSLNSNQMEKDKISSSNNIVSSASFTSGSSASSIPNAGTSGSSGTLSADSKQDKQRSHRHKKRERNKDRDKERERDKDRDRDRERDRDKDKDKDKDLKRDEKKEKDKHDKPSVVEAKMGTLIHPPLSKTITNSPSLSNLLEENNASAATICSSNHKKSQHNREKKSRDKSMNKEERNKRKQNELNEVADTGTAKGNKQIKLSTTNSEPRNQAVATTSLSPLSTSEHSQTTAVSTSATVTAIGAASVVQSTADLSDNDSLTSTGVPAANTTLAAATSSMYLTPKEQLRNKSNCSTNVNSNIKKVPSHLVHSDSSNSGCATDMSQQQPQQIAATTVINDNSSNRATESLKINNAASTPSANNMDSSQDISKITNNIGNKALKEKPAQASVEKNGSNKTDKMEEKRRSRSSVSNSNNTFIEPPLKQMKKDKEQPPSGKGALRDKLNKSPSLIVRQATTTAMTSRGSSCATSEALNAFLQPIVSPSLSNATTAITATVAATPAISSVSTTQLPVACATTTNKMAAHSPVLNVTEGTLIAQQLQQQQMQTQQQAAGSALAPPPPHLPPQTQMQTQSQVQPTQSQSVANTLSTDYWSELQELQQKIMTLQDSEDLQHVVELIAATGCYEITTKTFDFDLCKLDRNTVQRLQDFFAASVA